MILIWRKKENGLAYSLLFFAAGILNLIADILQIVF